MIDFILPILFAAAPTPAVPDYVPEVLARWKPYKLKVDVKVKRCGYVNAFYNPPTKTIELCAELIEQNAPELVRGILNHEMAHAFQWQRGIWDLAPVEAEADELGFLMSTPGEVAALVATYLVRNGGGGDTHPSDADRAAMLSCLASGASDPAADPVCRVYARSIAAKWDIIVTKTARRK